MDVVTAVILMFFCWMRYCYIKFTPPIQWFKKKCLVPITSLKNIGRVGRDFLFFIIYIL